MNAESCCAPCVKGYTTATPTGRAVAEALIEAARRKAAVAVRAEAQEIAADENDRAEGKQVVHDMETLRAG